MFKTQKGEEWLQKASENSTPAAFDYYYNRLKKFTLLRAYDNIGLDIRDIYDPDDILDTKKHQMQEDLLDNASLEDIALKIDAKIDEIKMRYVNNMTEEASQAGEGIFELIERFKEYPEVGVPLYGPLVNTVTRGARLKKFYLRSAATGVGKTRSMIADACYIGCPTLYITTEQEIDEVQTMMLAFLSNVNEEHIINGDYQNDEEERVMKAAEVIQSSPIYIEELPDFSLQDVENAIKKNLRDKEVMYVFNPKRVLGQ